MLVKTSFRTALLAAFVIALGAAAPPKPVKTLIPLPLKQIIPAGQRLCTAKTATGLGTLPLRPGSLVRPAAGDGVKVNYIGYLAATGEVFDQGMAAEFPVGGVIKGFGEGLQLMGKGAVMRLCIPAALGYGERATGPIPANADLVFQVELVDTLTS
ncbi:MAG: FKBP-type peptidyl-prolyl cis-trans isomerase [Novosphingobium sp.]|nr:FKBP-type peptidyl-prolyl cis-trans isomerase [Novosphingobium sp.]